MTEARRSWLGSIFLWWTVAVAVSFNLLSLLDRNVVAVILPEIRADLHLDAFQVVAVQGLGLALFYSLVGVLVGGLVDRFSRRWIMWASITLWSLATAATGLATNYREMFVARMLVGVGEAATSPAGHTLLAANFPRDRLATPLSMFTCAGVGGMGLAYALGGGLLTRFGHSPLPGFAALAPWRQVLVAIGLPGLGFALLAFTVRDPRKARAVPRHEVASWGEYFRYLIIHRRLLGGLMIGYGLTSIVNTATSFWAPTYARTVLHASAESMGYSMAVVVGVVGVIGGVAMGMITDWLTRRGVLDAPLRCYFFSAAVAIPVAAAGYLLDDLMMLYIGVAVFHGTVVASYGPMLAGLQIISPVTMRGRMASTILLTATLGAFAVGPMITGALISYVFGDAKMGLAVAATILVAGPLGALFIWRARKHYLARMEEILAASREV